MSVDKCASNSDIGSELCELHDSSFLLFGSGVRGKGQVEVALGYDK